MKKFKKVLLTCILTLSVFALGGCNTKSAEDTSMDAMTQLAIEQGAEQMLMQFVNLPDDQIDELIEYNEDMQNTVLASGLNSWKGAKKDLGEFVGIEGITTEKKSDGSYVSVVTAEFAERKCSFTLGLNKRQTEYTELVFSPDFTMKELLGQAAGNLVVGMGTVFAILIFIAWIISLFKYISVIGEKKDKKKEASKEEVKPVETPVPVIQPATSDDEFQAVIAAAIAAYEAETGHTGRVCANGITVRSIKRKNAQRRR
ncbi:MAG: OadG family transporter subunit [Eubacteriales bacterium]|nr:OadG family transporter subunit [Eubacteriales bacterium]